MILLLEIFIGPAEMAINKPLCFSSIKRSAARALNPARSNTLVKFVNNSFHERLAT